ncbi:hypothetical protein OO013_13685 [Mangrovivirga sp. M17]|uniref:DUF2846 domain-containing protein n=1 Tax=Mangrovivirga halotolerans TaxID=2993936 RepID=A0ABT3RT24_9BACT|nr:hypothetical protein [Mangrovivirga halotolerans]MCX2744929.1 hypothetical protein [Mangrovivirga halotolerans]
MKSFKSFHEQILIYLRFAFIFTILPVVVIISLSGCETDKNLYIYLSNESYDQKEIPIKVFIDDSLYIEETSHFSIVSNSFDSYVFKLDNGDHEIKVVTDDLMEIKTIDFPKEKYVTILYRYKLLGQEGREFYKNLYGKDHGYDTVLKPKQILIGIEESQDYIMY